MLSNLFTKSPKKGIESVETVPDNGQVETEQINTEDANPLVNVIPTETDGSQSTVFIADSVSRRTSVIDHEDSKEYFETPDGSVIFRSEIQYEAPAKTDVEIKEAIAKDDPHKVKKVERDEHFSL